MKGEQDMTYLKIDNSGKALFYETNKEQYISIVEITVDDIYKILDAVIEEEGFCMSDFQEREIVNPAEKIIYQHLYQQIERVKAEKTDIIDRIEQKFKEAEDKYLNIIN
ncbi:hypothetical protein [Salinicoccus sp. YB14-2]|uniref:hypothetical protein n=1 Tax=Salinicoccus sp. YB14-2 TaxID=1572701 RepID=UPI00068C20B4|nr:hypothetical protein [Salinicoccus sp. YB14-2]